jgi:hypothetical protein
MAPTPATPAPVSTPSFWGSIAESVATISVEVGEEFALAFLQSFLKKKTGVTITLPGQ